MSCASSTSNRPEGQARIFESPKRSSQRTDLVFLRRQCPEASSKLGGSPGSLRDLKERHATM